MPLPVSHVSVSGSTVVALFESHGRLATRERHTGVWSLRYLTAAGAQQQAVAATSVRSGEGVALNRSTVVRVLPSCSLSAAPAHG